MDSLGRVGELIRDTRNLLADGIVKLMRALAAVEPARVREWARPGDMRDTWSPA